MTMEPILSFRNVGFKYRGRETAALSDILFDLLPGEKIGIIGATGAGKSTLLRCANGIVPKFFKGKFEGDVLVKGESIRGKKVGENAKNVGALLQDFESQLFSTNARLDMAFGMENLGTSRAVMAERIELYSKLVGLEDFLDREPQSLSGGQKQRLALASILCLEPEILACDEPTTDLDPIGKQEVFDALAAACRSGRSVLLAEHDTERLLAMNSLIVMRNGKIKAHGSPAEILAKNSFCKENGIHQPQLFELFERLGLPERPQHVQEAFDALARHGFGISGKQENPTPPPFSGSELIEAQDIHFDYDPSHPVLRGISCSIPKGQFVAVLGQNGSGKTTLVKHFNGLLSPRKGRVTYEGAPIDKIGLSRMGRRVGFVFQNPDHMLFEATAFDEVAFGLRLQDDGKSFSDQAVEKALATVGLSDQLQADPFTMIKGDRQKLAVASILVCRPRVLILDEPTTGLDATEQTLMMELLQRLNQKGHTIIVITHSMRMAAQYADRVILMKQGQILADGPTEAIFSDAQLLSQTSLSPPPIVQLSVKLGSRALTVKKLAEELTGERR